MKKWYIDRKFLTRLFTAMMFVILSVAGVGFAIYLFFVSTSLYTYLIAICFMLLSLVSGFFNIYASVWYVRSYFYTDYLRNINKNLEPITSFPTVAVVVPAYNEEAAMVKKNLTRLKELNYPKDKIRFYLADDSTKPEISGELEMFCKRNGIHFLHRKNRTGYKAGALNEFMKISRESFVAIFDADEYLTDKNFLMDTLPYFQDPCLSYVQTEKRYMKGSFFSDSVDTFDAFFFTFIQPARALNNTAVFAGSCGLIRRAALDKIGGFPEYVIEDTFFSFESDAHNFKSLYLPKVYALGRPISTFSALVKQQWRYNYGDTQFIGYFFKRAGFSKRKSPLSNMDYVTHGFGLNYLSVFLILFTILSIGIVFSSTPFAHITMAEFFTQNQLSFDLELLGLFAFTLSLFVPIILAKMYFKSWRKGLMVFLLNYALAFIRTKAAIATFLNKDPGLEWNRNKISQKMDIVSTMMNTKVEIAFSGLMFVLAFVAYSQSNIAGTLWLMWYGVLYALTTIFLHKYG